MFQNYNNRFIIKKIQKYLIVQMFNDIHIYISLGIYYWNGTRDAKNSLLNDDKSRYNFNEYINYHRNDQNYMSMTLSFTGQNVSYKVN